jgi:hypothetical protein
MNVLPDKIKWNYDNAYNELIEIMHILLSIQRLKDTFNWTLINN